MRWSNNDRCSSFNYSSLGCAAFSLSFMLYCTNIISQIGDKLHLQHTHHCTCGNLEVLVSPTDDKF